MNADDIQLLASSIPMNSLSPSAFDSMKNHSTGMGITNLGDFNDVGQFANVARSLAMSKNTTQATAAANAMDVIQKTVFARYGS